ncbi:metal-dependent hydrolase [Variovorax terrae]|uniref:Metal-dependent hydrolase n=1 Tax=Variovorax terrae TaxID=2923278 RepID=A0A9X1VVH9_9BURK|nr:metal-dependent hydrolase [Variovorax terrae]MCJ0763929.1 metal-dependent hydrolase [Variovorax terrae]
MTQLPIRKLEVDLSGGFARHWHGGDPFRSQYYNALSMSFPVGEQFFIDSVRAALKLLPETEAHAPLRATIQGFIGQEATHRHIHGLYNAQLEKQGLVNRWQHWASWRIAKTRGFHPLHDLAVTCAYEHCTAVFADGTLRHASWFEAAEPRMRTLWRWHAAEETEHKAVAYDLYLALGGNHRWRVWWYSYVLAVFAFDAMRQTVLNLWRDGSLFKPRTWWGAATFFFGRDGQLWRCTGPLLAYYRRGFHPDQDGDRALAERWLAANADSFRVVRPGA